MNYDISGLESLIERHAGRIMKEGLGIGTGSIREEARPKSTEGARTKFRLISPEMGTDILAMQAEGMGCTAIGERFRISSEAVRTFIRKNGVKTDPERTKSLRSSEYKNVIQTRTK